MGILQVRTLEWVAMPSCRGSSWIFPTQRSNPDLPSPGVRPRSPTLQAESLPSKPPGKPKNTRVGSLSLLQEIFLTQEANQVLLPLVYFQCIHLFNKCLWGASSVLGICLGAEDINSDQNRWRSYPYRACVLDRGDRNWMNKCMIQSQVRTRKNIYQIKH